MDVTDNGVLLRKLRSGGVARSPLPETELIGETFARFIEDALRPLVKATISAMLVESRVLKLSEAIATISVPAMLGLIEVEDAETSGLMSIDTDLAYNLVDLTLGGDPSEAPPPTTRTFTGIDLALGRLHQEALLDAFIKAMAATMNRPIAKSMLIGAQHQNVSQLRFAPPYIDVLLFTVALDIGEAARTGNCALLLPLAALDVVRAAVREPASGDRERPDDLWRIAMRSATSAAPVRMDAVLHRQNFTLAELERLSLGDVVPLPRSAVSGVELVIEQPNGRRATVGKGRLGAYRSQKVLKLVEDLDRRVYQHVKEAL